MKCLFCDNKTELGKEICEECADDFEAERLADELEELEHLRIDAMRP